MWLVTMDSEKLLASYANAKEGYESFCASVADLINRLLKNEGILVHSLKARCKTADSLRGKIQKKAAYENLDQITDLVGVRIITHYASDVDRVAKLIEMEFDIDSENSVDKRVILDPDQFGYLSLHYVASLKRERYSLNEYRAYKGLRFEVQIRSILQHAWAEIEHDIGYKSAVDVPRQIRRRFSRLAGLLELADEEFIAIRNELLSYEQEIKGKITYDLEEIAIDRVSFDSFVLSNPVIASLDEKISKVTGGQVISMPGAVPLDVFDRVGIFSLAELETIVRQHGDAALVRAKMVRDTQVSPFNVPRGISVMYALQALVALSDDPSVLERYVANVPTGISFREQLKRLRELLLNN